MPRKSQVTHFPDTKISETFLCFAEPLLVGLGPDATEYQMEEALAEKVRGDVEIADGWKPRWK